MPLVPTQPISVGYSSANFHNHALSQLCLDLPSSHDKDKFEITCYSTGYSMRNLDKPSKYIRKLINPQDISAVSF